MKRCEWMLWFALATGASAWVQSHLFDGIPHVTDETSHWFQAQLFAAGAMYAPLPPCPQAFFQHNVVMTRDGRWFSKYPPGQALWMALGKRFDRVDWMMPLASALGLLAFLGLVRQVFDVRTARWAGVAWLISPQIQLLAGSYMSHVTALAWSLVATYTWMRALLAARQRAMFFWGIASGWFWLLAVITRPQDALLWALWVGVISIVLARPWNNWNKWLWTVPGVMLGALPLALFFGYRNILLFGELLLLGYYLPEDLLVMPLIKDEFGFSDTHTPQIALQYLLWGVYRLNRSLLGWPFSFLLIPFILWDRLFVRQNLWLIFGAALPFALYFLHSYYGFEYEARYYLFAVPLLLILVVRGGLVIWDGLVFPVKLVWVRCGLLWVLFLLSGDAIVRYWGQRVPSLYGPDYEQASQALHGQVLQEGIQPVLVLVPSGNIHRDFRYSSGFIFNDPWLDRPIIYARDQEQHIACLQHSYAERTILRAIDEDGRWRIEILSNPAESIIAEQADES